MIMAVAIKTRVNMEFKIQKCTTIGLTKYLQADPRRRYHDFIESFLICTGYCYQNPLLSGSVISDNRLVMSEPVLDRYTVKPLQI